MKTQVLKYFGRGKKLFSVWVNKTPTIQTPPMNKINSINVTEPCISMPHFLNKSILMSTTLKCPKQGSPLLFRKNVIFFKVP